MLDLTVLGLLRVVAVGAALFEERSDVGLEGLFTIGFGDGEGRGGGEESEEGEGAHGCS